MAKIDFRGHKIETRKRTHDWAARVTGPNGALFVGESEKDVEQQARDFIRSVNPWRDADEESESEEPEVA